MKKAPTKHNRLRRMEKHDYTSPCIYLITVTTEGRQRLLGSLVGDSAATAAIEPTPLGAYVAEAARITRAQCLDMNAYAADLATVALPI